MRFATIEDLKRVLEDNPPLSDFNSLDESEREKHIIILQNIYDGILDFIFRSDSISDSEEFIDTFNDYMSNSLFDSYNISPVMVYENVCHKWLLKLLNRMKEKLDRSEEVDTALLNAINTTYDCQRTISKEELDKYNEVFDRLIGIDPIYISDYIGNNPKYQEIALSEGYATVEDIIDYTDSIPDDEKIPLYRMLIKKDYDTVIKSSFFDSDYDFDFTEDPKRDKLVGEFLINNDCDIEIINKLLGDMYGASVSIYKISKMKPFPLTAETINSLSQIPKIIENGDDYDLLFGSLLQEDFEQLPKYKGRSLPNRIYQKLLNKQELDETDFNELTKIYESFGGTCVNALYDAIFKNAISKNPSLIKYYHGRYFDIYRYAIELGAEVDHLVLTTVFLMDENMDADELKVFFGVFNTKPINRMLFASYKFNHLDLLESLSKVDYLLQLLGIDRTLFIQFAFGSDFNWAKAISTIFDQNKVIEFASVKDYLFKNLYHVDNNTVGSTTIMYLIKALENYIKYPDLCRDLLNGEYSEEDLARLELLFNNAVVEDNKEIKNRDDLLKVNDIIIESLKDQIDAALKSENARIVKNVLSKILFGMDYNKVKNMLNTYGREIDFRQLLFENRDNNEILDDIHEMMAYASMMEDIIDCSDINALKEILGKILTTQEAYALCQKAIVLFNNYSEKMRVLYGRETLSNLTSLSNVPDELIDQEMTKKYGVKVIDFTESKYCLLAHTISRNCVDEVFEDNTNGERMTISFSPIGNRSQHLFFPENKIVLLTDTLDPNSFIRSSITDLHSNDSLSNYDFKITTEKFYNNDDRNLVSRQFGILHSMPGTKKWAPETLALRQGIKFGAISLPGGREPTSQEVELAKKHNLIFVKTQELDKTIRNPKNIHEVAVNERNHQMISDSGRIAEINKIHEYFKPLKSTKLKKIAVITDAHGLVEPTLAALNFAKKHGIDEIYSLGDNVGLGPNPKEVMDVLEAYNVKSVKGNQEEYLDGVERFKPHFQTEHKYEVAIADAERTKALLTPQQLEKIRSLPKDITVEIAGKKILLTHWTEDYITKEPISIPKDIEQVYQGHNHFSKQDGNVNTLRAVGFGNSGYDSEKANVAFISEKSSPTANYIWMAERKPNYDVNGLMYDLEENGLSEEAINKLEGWTGGRRR